MSESAGDGFVDYLISTGQKALQGEGKLYKETDPNGVPAGVPGAKLDAGKSPIMQGVFHYFPRALEAVANLSALGAQKYSWKGWEKVPDGINRYGNALGRHILKEATEGMIDQDPYMKPHGVLHVTQVAWNALARLELILREQEKTNAAQKG